MSDTSQRPERRKSGRALSDAEGWVIVPGRPAIRCNVINYSDGGAFLELGKPHLLPAEFQLLVERLKLRRLCEVRQIGMYGVGVAFKNANASETSSSKSSRATGASVAPHRSPRIKHLR